MDRRLLSLHCSLELVPLLARKALSSAPRLVRSRMPHYQDTHAIIARYLHISAHQDSTRRTYSKASSNQQIQGQEVRETSSGGIAGILHCESKDKKGGVHKYSGAEMVEHLGSNVDRRLTTRQFQIQRLLSVESKSIHSEDKDLAEAQTILLGSEMDEKSGNDREG